MWWESKIKETKKIVPRYYGSVVDSRYKERTLVDYTRFGLLDERGLLWERLYYTSIYENIKKGEMLLKPKMKSMVDPMRYKSDKNTEEVYRWCRVVTRSYIRHVIVGTTEMKLLTQRAT